MSIKDFMLAGSLTVIQVSILKQINKRQKQILKNNFGNAHIKIWLDCVLMQKFFRSTAPKEEEIILESIFDQN